MKTTFFACCLCALAQLFAVAASAMPNFSIVGENPQTTRWGEAVVLIRPRAAATPGPIKIRAETVRHGKYAPSAGELVFTPGSLKVSVSSAASGRRNAGLEKVESEQHEFEMK